MATAPLTASDVLARIAHRLPGGASLAAPKPEKPRVRMPLAIAQAAAHPATLAVTLPVSPKAKAATRTARRQPRHKRERPAMTAEEAQSFSTFSITNAMIVAESFPCGCEPYEDVFTFNRWLAQGFAVQKGQKATKITVWVDARPTDRDGDGDDSPSDTRPAKRPITSNVFCRHQVAEVTKGGDK